MKTPIQQLIERLNVLYDLNLLEQEYREGLADAIAEARLLLPFERVHIKHAWRDGADGVLSQTATGYFNEVYGKTDQSDDERLYYFS